MAQQDILGYRRDVRPNGQIFSSEFATITMGGRVSLVQQVQATYGQTVTPKFEVGSPTLYWLTGQPMGQVQIGRLVGRGGFLNSFGGVENSCGTLLSVKLGLDGTGGCSAAQGGGGSGLSFDGGVVENLTVSFQAGDLEVNEGAVIRVASMRRG